MDSRADSGGRAMASTKHAALVAKQGGRCALCERPFSRNDEITLDHIIPRSLGGPTRAHNLQAAHRACNQLRGTLPIPDWHRLRKFLLEGGAPPKTKVVASDIIVMSRRLELLERANAALSADWRRLKAERDEIERLCGGSSSRTPLVERVQRRISRRVERQEEKHVHEDERPIPVTQPEVVEARPPQPWCCRLVAWFRRRIDCPERRR